MSEAMPDGLRSALVEVGSKRARIIVAGGVLLLMGLVGLVLTPALTLQTSPGTRGIHVFFMIVSTLLTAIGLLAILGIGIIIPLGALRLRTTQIAQHATRIESHLDQMLRAQSAKIVGEILSQPRYQDPKRLNRTVLKVCSQNGEDGIIAEIFRRIGTGNRHFVEFGAADGLENNTALLLQQGWTGLWMDASASHVNKARATFARQVAGGKLIVLESLITAENIEDLFRQGKVPEEFDLLSIDLDRNDYYVWEKITHYRPRVVVIEYNSGIPPSMSWVVPYDATAFGWNFFGTGNGASLKALEELGARKGYSLVGCELCGVNSFFVRNDLIADHFAAPYTAENHFEPFRVAQVLMPRCDPLMGVDQQ